MSDNNALDQNEIERLLSGMGGPAAPSPPPPAATPPPSTDSSADSGILSQDELNALFSGDGSGVATASPSPPHATAPHSPAPPPPALPFSGGWNAPVPSFDAIAEDEDEGIQRGDLDYLAKKADESLRSIGAAQMTLPTEVIEFQFPEFGGTVPSTEHATLDQISEVDLDVKVELGRTYMYLEDVLKLRRGSVVPLDKMAGETVDIYINGRLLARGEVLVMNENFCVRIAELLAGAIPME